MRFRTRRPASSGSSRSTGSSSPIRPSSITASVAAAVIGLVVEAIRNSESRSTGAPPTASVPSASTCTSSPLPPARRGRARACRRRAARRPRVPGRPGSSPTGLPTPSRPRCTARRPPRAARPRSAPDPRRVSSTSAAPAFCSRYVAPLGPGDRHQILALGQHPGDRQLRRSDPLLLGDLGELGRELQVRVEVLPAEARAVPPEVVLVELVGRREASRTGSRGRAASTARTRSRARGTSAALSRLRVARSTASTRSARR